MGYLSPPSPPVTPPFPGCREKEARLDKALREVAAEKDQVSGRVRQEVHSMRETCTVQLEVERAKVNELEQQVKRLMGQVGGAGGRGRVIGTGGWGWREGQS